MGVSMRLYLAPDSDLYAFTGAPRTLQKWLRSRRSNTDMWLHGYWRHIDAILVSESLAFPKHSPLTPLGGDFVYPSAADHGAHGLSSTSSERLSRALELVTPAHVESYVRHWSLVHAPLPELTGGPIELEPPPTAEDVRVYLGCLQEVCGYAFDKKYGLVLALWEL
jgi:hypothetical protein